MEELRARTLELLEEGREAYGCSQAVIDRELAKAESPIGQSHLFAAIEAALQLPGFLSVSRTLFEAGCGTGVFLTAALGAGHDAWGIENDPRRLAVAGARIEAFNFPAQWKDRAIFGDASATNLEPNRFDIVLGHQFIEHVPDPASTVSELLRVAKPGGYVVLFAPDYRAPFEAHYEIPWPPFLSKDMCKAWLDGFERPYGGLETFFYVTAPQLVAIFQSLNCRIINAYNDRALEQHVMRHFDCSTAEATRETARRTRAAFENRSLPETFMSATSFGIAVQKL